MISANILSPSSVLAVSDLRVFVLLVDIGANSFFAARSTQNNSRCLALSGSGSKGEMWV